jgi:hypothetical protein
MFGLGFGFLSLTAIALIHADTQPRVLDGRWIAAGCALAWLAIALDAATGLLQAGVYSRERIAKALLLLLAPPFRMAVSTHAESGCLWLPYWGWQPADQALYQRLERVLSIPMLGIAALILPVLAVEVFGRQWIDSSALLSAAVRFGTAFIWLAFATELVLMVSLSQDRIRYCREHWIDIVIVILPMVAFLRGVRLLKVARLARLSKSLRVFRLRGLAMRAYRGLVVLSIVERLIHRDPEKHLAHLQDLLAEKEEEIAQLRDKIREVESAVAAQRK